jgi:hypothetical protein
MALGGLMEAASSDSRGDLGHLAIQLPSHGEISGLAYLLYLRRGREAGRDLDDWLNAERFLIEEARVRQQKRILFRRFYRPETGRSRTSRMIQRAKERSRGSAVSKGLGKEVPA